MAHGSNQGFGGFSQAGSSFGGDSRFDRFNTTITIAPAGGAQRRLEEDLDRQAQQLSVVNAANALGSSRNVRVAGLGRSLLDRRQLEQLAIRRGLKRSRLSPGLFFDPNDPEQLARETRVSPVAKQPSQAFSPRVKVREEQGTFLTSDPQQRARTTASGVRIDNPFDFSFGPTAGGDFKRRSTVGRTKRVTFTNRFRPRGADLGRNATDDFLLGRL